MQIVKLLVFQYVIFFVTNFLPAASSMERELSVVNKAYIRMNVKHDQLDEKVDAIQNKV